MNNDLKIGLGLASLVAICCGLPLLLPVIASSVLASIIALSSWPGRGPGPQEDSMRELPARPDLAQLRRQARELQHAAARGDASAIQRLQTVSSRVTLVAAQLALAREYGFRSWAQLKYEVERRIVARSGQIQLDYVVRPVTCLQELVDAFDAIAAQLAPRLTHEDRRFDDLAGRFPEDRSLMLVVELDGRIVGGALAFRNVRHRGSGVTLRMMGLEPSARGRGLGRRLMEAVELAAMRLGAHAINLGGASSDIKAFYTRMGYSGRGTMMSKSLPLPGRFLEARLRRLAAT